MKRFFILAVCMLLATPAMAADYDYRIIMLNMPIGMAHITLDNPGGDYHLGMHGKFTGLLSVFVGGKGDIEIAGTQIDGLPHTAHADGTVAWGEKPRRTLVDFTGGNPTNIDITPPYNYNPKKRVPLDPATLNGTLDPLSAMIQPLHDGKPDCTVRPRIFDGHERYDLQFSPTADPMTCTIQPVNISGYDRKYDDGSQPRPLDVTFTPVENGQGDKQYAIPSKIVRELALGRVDIELTHE